MCVYCVLTSLAPDALRSALPRTCDDVACADGDLDPLTDVGAADELLGKLGLL